MGVLLRPPGTAGSGGRRAASPMKGGREPRGTEEGTGEGAADRVSAGAPGEDGNKGREPCFRRRPGPYVKEARYPTFRPSTAARARPANERADPDQPDPPD